LLQRRLGVTFVFVTHAQSEALALSDRIVVMNAGRIEQVSAPYELYTRPQTLFVARFIGRNALIPGTIAAADADNYRLNTAFGEISGTSGGIRPRVGMSASVAVPAEAIDVLPTSTPFAQIAALYGGSPVKGTVESIQQVGHIVQLAIIIGAAEPIVVEGHADKYAGRFHAQDEVLLTWKKEAATLITH
jgi:putative spermidine/putrescine transport system ATP-binding protein/spermidine/putrescine transport system ATP-binding protein